MSTTSVETILNDVLIVLHRSLLQYVGEAWPWTNASTEEAGETVQRLVADQEHTVDRLAELLRDRGHAVSFDVFPDFSNLNYVSLDYLLSKLVQNQRQVVARCEAAARELADEPEDGGLAQQIAMAEAERLKALEGLARSRPT